MATTPTTSTINNSITTTAGALCLALWGHIDRLVDPADPTRDLIPESAVNLDGRWVYGLSAPFEVRAVPACAPITLVVCPGMGYVTDSEGGWIADRFGNLGLSEARRAAKALLAA